MIFSNRKEAGRELAKRLKALNEPDSVVIALPRGGVPVAAEVARELGAPLDILVARKVGPPENPEYGVGAVTEDAYVWIDRDAAHSAGMSDAEIKFQVDLQLVEAERRARLYRSGKKPIPVSGRTVFVVDDGLATGNTARVAVRLLRSKGARKIVLALPVCSLEGRDRLKSEVDKLICLEVPQAFFAVGNWYEDFSQVSDAEVATLLRDFQERSVQELVIRDKGVRLVGELSLPPRAWGVIIFAHGSGSGRFSPRNQEVARNLNYAGFGTFLLDLLTEQESKNREKVFDIPLLANRLRLVIRSLRKHPQSELRTLPIGLFGASTGAAAALLAASELRSEVSALVSRGGRPDLAREALLKVLCPTLLIVGGNDDAVLDLNRAALRELPDATLVVVPGATHLFEEEGALAAVSRSAIDWFSRHLGGHPRQTAA